MWECGLKQIYIYNSPPAPMVTPYVGVWIETIVSHGDFETEASLLMWECGLKHKTVRVSRWGNQVTPYVGVWIET